MRAPEYIGRGARARIQQAHEQIATSLRMVGQGTPLAAEWEPGRLVRRLQAKAQLSREEATAIATGICACATSDKKERAALSKRRAGPERIYGATIDFVDISFLERGATIARAVGRVAFRDGRPQGTGFLVSDRLFLTNHHVIPSLASAEQFVVEFDYEYDAAGRRREPTRFLLDPGAFFLTNPENNLDFTLVAIGRRESGQRGLGDYGWCHLSDSKDKHALGEVANIVQHPDGRFKEVVLRENRLVSRLDTVLHYVADTEPGSSGSPVFNNEWGVIALHHWGGPWRQTKDEAGRPVPREVNEGIRTSAIVAELKTARAGLAPGRRGLLDGVLRQDGEASAVSAVGRAPAAGGGSNGSEFGPRLGAEGRVTWTVPIEISVCVPGNGHGTTGVEVGAGGARGARGAGGAASGTTSSDDAAANAEVKLEIDSDYGNRVGYDPAFLVGHVVPLPLLSAAQAALAARNLKAGPSDDPHELKYEHFSVVMNRDRHLAYFTASNIDGPSAKKIDRDTGSVVPRQPTELDESLAEASEKWYDDPRLEPGVATPQALYAGQEVPGYPNKKTRAWQNRMFQRGHLVRRVDPAWGTDDQALKANADTFHFTNCTPQVGFFNMGTVWPAKPGTGGGQLWRGTERYVLTNVINEQQRICVFAGPIFDDAKDPLWRPHIVEGFRVPLRFWKVVVWAGAGKLSAVALIVDQEQVIEVMPEAALGQEGLEGGAEEFTDLSRVQDFVTTVAEVERVTGLDFGAAVRAADVNAGERAGGAARGRRRGRRGRDEGRGGRAGVRRGAMWQCAIPQEAIRGD